MALHSAVDAKIAQHAACVASTSIRLLLEHQIHRRHPSDCDDPLSSALDWHGSGADLKRSTQPQTVTRLPTCCRPRSPHMCDGDGHCIRSDTSLRCA